MITAADTDVLIDVFAGDPRFGPLSRVLLSRCLDEGALLVSDVVRAETAATFPGGQPPRTRSPRSAPQPVAP